MEREYIRTCYDSQFVDMECGSSGEIAFIFNIPSVFVKGISNLANNKAAINYQTYSYQANQYSNKVVLQMLKSLICNSDLFAQNISCSIKPNKFSPLNYLEMLQEINKCKYVSLSVSANNISYVVPMCFKFNSSNPNIIKLYSLPYGKK